MNIEELRELCLSVPGSEESFPFDDTVLVFKIMGKIFSYVGLDSKGRSHRVNLKCETDRSIALRERYEGVGDSHYSHTLLWIGVDLESDVPDELIIELIKHSVDEVVRNMPRKKREEYLAFVDEFDR